MEKNYELAVLRMIMLEAEEVAEEVDQMMRHHE